MKILKVITKYLREHSNDKLMCGEKTERGEYFYEGCEVTWNDMKEIEAVRIERDGKFEIEYKNEYGGVGVARGKIRKKIVLVTSMEEMNNYLEDIQEVR